MYGAHVRRSLLADLEHKNHSILNDELYTIDLIIIRYDIVAKSMGSDYFESIEFNDLKTLSKKILFQHYSFFQI